MLPTKEGLLHNEKKEISVKKIPTLFHCEISPFVPRMHGGGDMVSYILNLDTSYR
jgi:hypothetical protein